MAQSPPLIPRRVSKSYENVKLKGQESIDQGTMTTSSMLSHPPIPPRKGYENVELKIKKEERGTENGATSPGINPPIPLKRSRSPQPPKEYCSVTPPRPARRTREKGTETKTKLFKVTSMPYCPLSPDSPQLPAREKTRSTSNPVLPLKESDDSANCDSPSPYYSLPPDSLSPMAEIDARFQIDDSEEESELIKDGDERFEMYLTLDEEKILSTAKNGGDERAIKSPIQCPSVPPLPPKVSKISQSSEFFSSP